MSAAEAVEGKTAIRNREYVESNISNGVDWRNRVPNAPGRSESGYYGVQRGQAANRMKKRGMSWSIRGANRMAKTIQLCRNGELSIWHKDLLVNDESSTCARAAQEHNESQRPV